METDMHALRMFYAGLWTGFEAKKKWKVRFSKAKSWRLLHTKKHLFNSVDTNEYTREHIKQTLKSEALKLSLEYVMFITPCYLKVFYEENM